MSAPEWIVATRPGAVQAQRGGCTSLGRPLWDVWCASGHHDEVVTGGVSASGLMAADWSPEAVRGCPGCALERAGGPAVLAARKVALAIRVEGRAKRLRDRAGALRELGEWRRAARLHGWSRYREDQVVGLRKQATQLTGGRS